MVVDQFESKHRYRPDELLGPLNEAEVRNAPAWLYVRGDTRLLDPGPRVAVVGTRHSFTEGLSPTRLLARELVDLGVVVISGLARGVDTAVHTATLEAGGRTIAVLGTPLNVVYPRENAALQQRIGDEHLLISQFLPGHPVARTNFPRRNLTMTLLASVTIIVEARERSGLLSQGWEALRLGRALFLSRSLAENGRLTWPAAMMRYGAQVLTETEELLDHLPPASSSSGRSLVL